MPVGFVEPFDVYPAPSNSGDTGGITHVWNVTKVIGALPLDTTAVQFVTGLGGQGKALNFKQGTAGGGWQMSRTFNPTRQLTLAFGLKVNDIGQTIGDLIVIRDEFGNRQFGIGITIDGRLYISGEGAATVATAVNALQLGSVYRYVMRIDVSGTSQGTDSIITKINGRQSLGLTASNIDLRDATSDNLGAIWVEARNWFNGPSHSIDFTLDDMIVIYDELVDIPPVEMFTFSATADILKQWTPLTGTDNYPMINNVPIDADVSYNSDTVVGHKDIFQFGTWGLRIPESIYCISQQTVSKKDESATRSARNVMRIAGTDYPDAVNFDENEVYMHYFTHNVVNPATGVPFVSADFPLQSGYELMV